VLVPAALVCDVLDGHVARPNRAGQSRLGADLDPLADVIFARRGTRPLGLALYSIVSA
jgi:phosphatidylserine synthase